ncbi:MAG: transketolase [Candidatus Hydrogenedentota bacterium]
MDDKRLQEIAHKVRKYVIEMTFNAGSGHPGGSLSATDVLTFLYFEEMNVDPASPDYPERDRFVLCKGHSAPALYAVLALKGFFPEEELKTLRKLGSRLQGHPERTLPGIEVGTGSLGQGLSIALGIALAARLDKRQSRVYALMGDGEQQEGQVWEAAMACAHYKVSNLCAIVDKNRLQIDGSTDEVMDIEPLDEKYKAFGWNVLKIDGHSFTEIRKAFNRARECKECPTLIIANTIKGKGVSFMENSLEFHGRALTEDELKRALNELLK